MSLDLSILTPAISFVDRPVAVSGADRVQWRLGALVLVLGRCRGRQTSLSALHVLLWAMSSERSRLTFGAWWSGRRFPSTTTFRFDPIVDRTIDLAIGSGLVEVRSSGKIRLAESGAALFATIRSNAEIFVIEKGFLDELPSSLAESEIRTRLGWDGEQ